MDEAKANAKPGAKPGPKPGPKPASQPTGSTVPPAATGPRPAGKPAGKILEPLSYNEARKGIAGFHRGAAKLLGSKVEFEDSDFDQAGDALKDVADRVPPLRLVLRLVAPIVLVGALAEVWRRILAETPWWQRLRQGLSERQQRQDAKNQAAKVFAEARAAAEGVRQAGSPAVPVSSPNGPGGPGGSHPAHGGTEPQETPPPLPPRGPALGRFGGLR